MNFGIKFFWGQLFYFLFCLFAAPTMPLAAAELLAQETFDHGDLSKTLTRFNQSGNKTQRLVRDPIGGSGYVVEQSVRKYEDNVPYRTELRLKAKFEYGKDYWLTFKTFIPESWVTDENNAIVAQMHGVPDLKRGEGYRNPAIALYIKGDNWMIGGKWDDKVITPPKGYAGAWQKTVSKLRRGRWETWVLRMVLSYTANGSGRLIAWKNGEKVFDREGPNTFNDTEPPYFKFGLYIPSWRPDSNYDVGTSRRFASYFDDFEMGVGLCGNPDNRSWCPGNPVSLSVPYTPLLTRPERAG